MQNSKVRTRIAPSPTGYPHIGTIYQALFDYAYAKKNHGSFIVRIEDTDRERFVPDAEQKIYEALDFFGLSESESPRKNGQFSPYRQSERLEIYKKYSKELLNLRGAYFCFCSKERLEELHKKLQDEKKPTIYDKHCRNLSQEDVEEKLKNGESYVIRLKIPDKGFIKVKDEIRGEINFETSLLEDAVLIKSDGYPTYHFASVVDDHLMEISHVVRGEEWLPSLPKHIVLYDYFGWEKPLFFHTATLRNPDKTKLSKRHGHANVDWYKEQGFLPQALLNFLALLGWSHPQGKEEFSLTEFIKLFDLKDLKAVSPIFDISKLEWLNGVYIRAKKPEDLKSLLLSFYKDDKELAPIFESKNINLLIGLAQTRMKTLKEFKDLVLKPNVQRQITKDEKEAAKLLVQELSKIEHIDWREDKILEVLRNFKNQHGVSMKTIYFIITGREQGLPLIETMVKIEGREEVLERLQNQTLGRQV